jgi:acyl-CoA thioesterase
MTTGDTTTGDVGAWPMVETFTEALELEPLGDGRSRVHSLREIGEGDVVFGGQAAAQLLAAAAAVDPAKPVKAISALFDRAAVRHRPVELEVEVLRKGRSFTNVTVTSSQDGRLCARALVMLSLDEPDTIRHGATAPAVPPPEDCLPWDAYRVGGRGSVAGRALRVVDGVDTSDPDAVGPAELRYWASLDEPAATRAQSQAFLPFATAGPDIGVAMRPHPGFGTRHAHARISTGILAHAVTFHEPFDAREWLLVAMESPYAGRGRSYARGDVFRRDGVLVASFTQDNMIRELPDEGPGAGRTTL